MVGNECMQYADAGDRTDQQQAGTTTHLSATSKIFGDRLELIESLASLATSIAGCNIQAMVKVIVNERLFGLAQRALGGLQLLRHIKSGSACLDHGADAAELTLGTLEAFEHLGVAQVSCG